jgi:hypothetical protein
MSKGAKKPRRAIPWHPFLFAAIPVLALYQSNIRQGVSAGDILEPLGVVLAGAAVAFALAWLVLRRSALKAALATSVLAVLFFTFGPVLSHTASWPLLHGGTVREALLIALWASALFAGTVAIARSSSTRIPGLTRNLNFIAAGLVVFNLAGIGLYKYQEHGRLVAVGKVVHLKKAPAVAPVGHPDIYLIVLDDYGGVDAMRDLIGYDNEPFLQALRQRGFYVPDHATTNYPHTAHELAAEFNLDYLGALLHDPKQDDWQPTHDLIQHDLVPSYLKESGYRYVHMGSWWTPTVDNPQADVTIKMPHGGTEFTNALIAQTIGGGQDIAKTLGFQTREYTRVLFEFSQFNTIKGMPGPKYVFAHILVPHGPYVFGADGHFVDPSERAEHTDAVNYANQVRFANAEALKTIDLLQSGPVGQRPVIVLQSDEGFYTGLVDGDTATSGDLEQHFGILNSYYFPRLAKTGLYPTITPVNTFRLLFDDYFDAGLPLLPDRNYATQDIDHLYRYIDVTSRVRS